MLQRLMQAFDLVCYRKKLKVRIVKGSLIGK